MHRSAWVCLSAPMISNRMTGIDKLIGLFKSFRMIVLNIYWTRIGTLSTTWKRVSRLFFSHRRNFWVLSTPPPQTYEIDLRTTEFFSIVARTRRKSHTTPNTECVTIFYKISESVQWGKILTNALLKPTEFSQQLLVPVVNDLLIRSESRFSTKDQFSEVQSSHAHSWKPPSHSWKLLVRVENDLLIRSVSRFSAKDQFIKVKSSQAHF